MQLTALISIAFLCIPVAACGTNDGRDNGESPAPDPASARNDDFAHIAVNPDRVTGGGRITLTLSNRSEHDLGYNLCPVALERRVGDEWESRAERPAEVCTMELRILNPNASATYEHTVPRELPSGTYRFRASLEWPLGGSQVSIASEPFEVAS